MDIKKCLAFRTLSHIIEGLTREALMALNVGDVAPDFTVTDTDGKSHTLSTMLEQGPVILVFFPKAYTPG